jgi:hypothetical protein
MSRFFSAGRPRALGWRPSGAEVRRAERKREAASQTLPSPRSKPYGHSNMLPIRNSNSATWRLGPEYHHKMQL